MPGRAIVIGATILMGSIAFVVLVLKLLMAFLMRVAV